MILRSSRSRGFRFVDVPVAPGHLCGDIGMSKTSTESKQKPAFALRVRDGFTVHPDVLRHLADMSVDALQGQGTAYRNACRSLSELTRLVGEILRRARARSRKAAQPAGPALRPAETRAKADR